MAKMYGLVYRNKGNERLLGMYDSLDKAIKDFQSNDLPQFNKETRIGVTIRVYTSNKLYLPFGSRRIITRTVLEGSNK